MKSLRIIQGGNLKGPRLLPVVLIFFVLAIASFAAAAEEIKNNGAVELNGDTIEYSMDGNTVTATGNVVINYQEATLLCDKVEFSRDTKMARAQGHVRLITTQGEISGNRMTFNFASMTGDFFGARIISAPFYGAGKKVSRVDESKMVMQDGYMTTCDHDKPHFRMASRKLDVIPGEKLTARRVRFMLGEVPLMFIPQYTQNLKDKPRVILTPGYDKEWGAFLLQAWRYKFSDDFKGYVHLDYREKKDFASGVDVKYNLPNRGSGIVRTYYMSERNITSKRWYLEKPSPTIEKERFKVEWRHKWTVDETTEAVAQYYRLSDNAFLKDYFEREFQKESSPKTFFLLTKGLPMGVTSFRTEARVNRFESAVERLPELRYDLANQQMGEESPFYFSNITTYSNLTSKDPSPSELRRKTMRLDTDNEFSYLTKIGFIEFKPFVGGQNTYYSRTLNSDKYGAVRGIFKTGSTLSTKFYKVVDVEQKIWWMELNRLRHIVMPTIFYEYNHEPSLPAFDLDKFDGTDSLDNVDNISLALENKFQTKRNGKVVDLLRAIVDTDFRLKDDPAKGGFDLVNADLEFKPNEWLDFYYNSIYDSRQRFLTTVNFDIYIDDVKGKWKWGLGRRYSREVDDQITTEFQYIINPKWKFKLYERFDTLAGSQKEQQFTVTRDLHEWTMDINFSESRGQGSEIWIVFTLKAFPDMMLDFGTSFNRRKAGSQSWETPPTTTVTTE